MRDGSSNALMMMEHRERPWRELYRCDDLRQARAVATCIAAMEFDVRLCAGDVNDGGDDLASSDASATESAASPTAGRLQRGAFAFNRFSGAIAAANPPAAPDADAELPGPYVIEVLHDTWPQLADVLLEIITEQQEFDQMLEWRRERFRTRLVVVLSVTTAAEVLLIWRLLEG